jgi:hypothetical protein
VLQRKRDGHVPTGQEMSATDVQPVHNIQDNVSCALRERCHGASLLKSEQAVQQLTVDKTYVVTTAIDSRKVLVFSRRGRGHAHVEFICKFCDRRIELLATFLQTSKIRRTFRWANQQRLKFILKTFDPVHTRKAQKNPARIRLKGRPGLLNGHIHRQTVVGNLFLVFCFFFARLKIKILKSEQWRRLPDIAYFLFHTPQQQLHFKI